MPATIPHFAPSKQDAYTMIKTVYQMRDDAVFRLIINQVLNEAQAKAVAAKLTQVTQQVLGKTISYLGHIPRDPHVQQSVMQSYPFVLRFPSSPAAKSVAKLAERLKRQRFDVETDRPGFFRRIAENLGLASNG